jgi:serine/threonine protein kinase
MPLTARTRLGAYEIVSAIGAGGMGEVYRAHDSRLDRDVAIKVLPPSVAGDQERRTRFEREARAIAALSHPNILAIHDIGEMPASDAAPGPGRSSLYVVTELLEGETLRDHLSRGALPVRKAIETATQIARGLAAAHDRGIVHRDLKPENVFVLPDGRVKILDFGLAKGVAKDPGAADATVTAAAMTDPGTVMGTVGYMAPEQIRGLAVDARTDLFALGALLYEMLSGQRAFRRETAAETMTAILREDPPELSASRAELPPALERIVRHCLEKNPAERFQTARDVAFALEAFSGTAISSSKVADIPAPRRSLHPAMLAAAFAVVGVAAGYGLTTLVGRSPAEPIITFETRTSEPQWITNARFAPDGETLVYSAATSGNTPSVFLLRKGGIVPQRLGEPGTHLLSVSRTGELAVLTGVSFLNHRLFRGTLTRMTMDGGARPLSEGVREADWAPDGSAMAVIRDTGIEDQLEYPAGKTVYEHSGYLSDPRVSPDGSQIAFLEHPHRGYDDRGWLKVIDRTGTVRTLAGEFWGAEGVAWSPDGRMIFLSTSVPDAFGYLPHVVNVEGEPKLRPAFPSMTSAEVMDVAPDGRLLVSAGEHRISIRVQVPGETTERELPWLELPVPTDLSADGKWLLFTDQSASAGMNYAVAWRRTDGSPAVRLGEGFAAALSPDARWAVGYVSSPAPGHYVAYPTGPGQPMRLDFSPVTEVVDVAFFPDGRLMFCGSEPQKPQRCYRRDLAGGQAEAVTPENVLNGLPAPNGRTIAITTTTRDRQVMEVGGGQPRAVPGYQRQDRLVGWSGDSRALFVQAGNGLPAPLDRIGLASGTRTRVRDVMPPDRLGIMQVHVAAVSHDGQAYSYMYWRQTSKAIVVNGLKRQ